MNRAVFLDRDGTLMVEVDYCHRPEDVQLLPGVPEALARLRAAGFKNVIITNQSGLARGKITPPQYAEVHAQLLRLIGPEKIDATYMCPDFGERRKPSPAMILEAARDLKIDLTRSFMIGDKTIDVQCGQHAGTRTIFVETGYPQSADCQPDFVAKDLSAAVDYILQHGDRRPPIGST